MRGLILAAGRGARLRPLTDDRPKCLVRLGGRTLLDWELAAFRAAGIDEAAIVTGWRGTRIRRRGLVRFVNRAWRRTDMVTSLLCARRWLAEGPCIVAYGDSVHHPAVLRRLAAADDDVAIAYDTAWRALWRARFARPEDDAESLRIAQGRVRAIGGRLRDLADADGQFMGVFRLTPRGLARIESALAAHGTAERARLQTTQLLAALVAAGEPVGAIAARGLWCEVDGPDDVALYEHRLRARVGWRHDWRFRCG